MKIVLLGFHEYDEEMHILYELLDFIKHLAIPLEKDEVKDNAKFIYVGDFDYKFDRFDQRLVKLSERENYKKYFYTKEIDDRFTNSKYYFIETEHYTLNYMHVFEEKLNIKFNNIVDDLYYKRYIYE